MTQFFINDTSWDRAECTDNCCDDTTQHWFCYQLNEIAQDGIKVQVCSVSVPVLFMQPTLIGQLELYM